jgi:hypothetical protein
MAKKPKKTKALKRHQRKTKERRKNDTEISESRDRLMERTMSVSHKSVGVENIEGSNQEKMSEIILNYAQPLLDASESDEQMKRSIFFAATLWNASFLEEAERNEFIRKMLIATDDQQNKDDVVEYFLARKAELYPDVKRVVIDYELVETEHSFHLNVVSNVDKKRIPDD